MDATRAAASQWIAISFPEAIGTPAGSLAAQVRATGRACAAAGFGYRVLSEPDRQLLVNVRWLAGFREPPADLDGERARMLAVLAAGPSTIAEMLSGALEVALARPVLMHLLWTGAVIVDVGAPIQLDSRVWAPSMAVA